MGNRSPLADLVVDFGMKKSNPRKSKVLKITPHHMAAVMAADDCARSHLYSSRESSANYYIGNDGTICAGVAENRRAWTSSSRENDHQAITIEVSNNSGAPSWTVSEAAYGALVALCADICQRYGIKPHFTGDTSGTITIHKMFQNTDCPGPYLEKIIRSGQLERDILAKMGQPETPQEPKESADPNTLYRVQVGAFRIVDNALREAERLETAGFSSYLVKVGGLIKVQAGAFRDKDNARRLMKKIQSVGFNAIITTQAGIAYKPGTGKRSPEEIAREVIAGKWGNDPARRAALAAAGYNPAEIQTIVNKLLNR